jgi:hypothetical protein
VPVKISSHRLFRSHFHLICSMPYPISNAQAVMNFANHYLVRDIPCKMALL